MGRELAGSVIIGSLLMMLSDNDNICDDRNLNTLISAMIIFFYSAEACWAALLSYASFNAIIYG